MAGIGWQGPTRCRWPGQGPGFLLLRQAGWTPEPDQAQELTYVDIDTFPATF